MSVTTQPAPPATGKRPKKGPQPKIALAGDPSVNLLPPSVRDRAVVRSRIRTGVLFVVLGAIIAAGLFAFSTFRATQAQDALNAANNRTAELLMEQNKYAEAMRIDALIAQIEELQKGATAAEIAWADLLSEVLNRLPAGAAVEAISFTGVEPWAKVPVADGGSETIATIHLTLSSVSIPDSTAFVRSLSTIEGFQASTITTVAVGVDGLVSSSIDFSLTWGAESGRYGTIDRTGEQPAQDSADAGTEG